MKIAYIARWDVGVESGVLKKMVEQLAAWRAAGHEVCLFALSSTTEVWAGVGDIPVEVVDGSSPWTRGIRFRDLLRQVERWAPDVAYLRFLTYYAALESFLQRVPTVAEVNTDDVAEYKLYLPFYQYWYHRALRDRVLRRMKAFIAVTHELGSRFAGYGVPVAVIGNGIDLDLFRTLPPASGERTRLIFIGAPASGWHGVDKIVRWATQTPEWDFELVGASPQPTDPPNLRAHGHLQRDAYEPIVARADIAIGTMGLHRKGMNEACPLKVREYLAYGLPCINGYTDTDFPDGAPFVLQLPNQEDNLERTGGAIQSFVERWKGRRVPRRSISHLHVAHKEKLRLDFLANIIARGERRKRGGLGPGRSE